MKSVYRVTLNPASGSFEGHTVAVNPLQAVTQVAEQFWKDHKNGTILFIAPDLVHERSYGLGQKKQLIAAAKEMIDRHYSEDREQSKVPHNASRAYILIAKIKDMESEPANPAKTSRAGRYTKQLGLF